MKTTLPVLLFALATLPGAASAASTGSPNIIVILADDFGWGSLGCYGAAGLRTPHLDRLAREGRRFTHAYAPGSVCSPTRYGLMTGRYYWRTSVKDGQVLNGNAPLHIETTRTTLASLCRGRGYATAAFGKWHLGLGAQERIMDWSVALKPGPRDLGFDYFFGLAANPWNGPHYYLENEGVLGRLPGHKVELSGQRETATSTGLKELWQEADIMTTLTGKVTGWIERNRAKPFFVYYAPNAIHEPVVPHARYSGSSYGKYGDFIHELDASVGEILATLDRWQLADRTLVLFTSDNGGVVNRGNPNASRALDAGLAINGPLRGGKHTEWEGGFREPFLVRWPGRVPAGTVSEQVVGLTDVLATLAGILQVPLAPGNAEDSLDVLRAFTESSPGTPVRDHVILQSADGTYTYRAGDWKLIERVGAPTIAPRNAKKAAQAAKKAKSGPQRDELYNLREDPSETNDVAAAHPEIVVRLKAALTAARDRGHTRPDAK
ncbi:MAG: arylsulfatase [Verrucomicrobia bacterium]|nr:arylsulfatase [Verrucomicrobiota bacterium]